MANDADPELIITLFIELTDHGFDGEEFRNSVANTLERLVRRNYPVGDEVLGQLEHWLERKPHPEVDENANSEQIGDRTKNRPLKKQTRRTARRVALYGTIRASQSSPGATTPVLETISSNSIPQAKTTIAWP